MANICPTCKGVFAPSRRWQKYCCVKCRRASPQERRRTQKYQQTRRQRLNEIKLYRGCDYCGYNGHPAALDFNHVRGEKLFNVSQDSKKAWAKLLAEIDKCEVVCANCHRIHTQQHRHWHTKRKVPLKGPQGDGVT